jgi:4'-phosphopantetheinyl transferase
MTPTDVRNPAQVDLWYVFLDKTTDPRLQNAYRALLSPDESQREQRFVVEHARLQFLVSRALLRTVLAHYTGRHPRELAFRRNSYGKPCLIAPDGLPLEFNLSNTRALAVCAVGFQRAVGVDAEDCEQERDGLSVARRYFHASEVGVLESLPCDQQRLAFYQWWTLKEAFLKAYGTGLSTPLDSFAITWNRDRPPEISFPAPGWETPGDWQFARLTLVSRFAIALAAHMPSTPRLQLVVRQTVPLSWQEPGKLLPANTSNHWFL